MIRVLHVLGIMDRGGAETMIMNLYRQIDRSRIQFDFVVHLHAEGAYDQEIQQLGGKIYHCPRYILMNHLHYARWWERFFGVKGRFYRIVHGHVGTTAAIYLRIAKSYGLYTIAHSHDTYGSLTVKELLYRMLSYKTRYTADYFFACSKQAGNDRFGKEILFQRDHFTVFPNAIDTTQFAYDQVVRKNLRETFNVEEGTLLLGHVGRFQKVKNHRFIVQIFNSLLQAGASAKLLLVGDGPLRKETRKQAENLGIADRVLFTGVRSDVADLLQAMDVMLFPSFHEGLPVTLVEAQAAGLPVVMSERVPEDAIIIPELVQVERLDSPAEYWVRDILVAASLKRTDRKKEMTGKGFDIQQTSKWLEDFYIGKSKG